MATFDDDYDLETLLEVMNRPPQPFQIPRPSDSQLATLGRLEHEASAATALAQDMDDPLDAVAREAWLGAFEAQRRYVSFALRLGSPIH